MPVVTGRTKSATSISTSGISCTSPRVMRLKEISMLPARATMASPTVTLVRNGPLNTACRTLIEESSGCEDDQAALQGAENRSCLAQVMRSGTVGLDLRKVARLAQGEPHRSPAGHGNRSPFPRALILRVPAVGKRWKAQLQNASRNTRVPVYNSASRTEGDCPCAHELTPKSVFWRCSRADVHLIWPQIVERLEHQAKRAETLHC